MTLAFQHMEVLELRSVIFVSTKISKFWLKLLLTFHPIHNTSIRWATFRVMKHGHYVIVDDGSNYVTFHKLNAHIKIRKIPITPHNDSSSRLCSSAIGLSKLILSTLVPPSFLSCKIDTKLSKPWKMLLILSNLHSTWTKCATFLWQTFLVLCSKRNISIGPVNTVVWETVSFKNKHARKNIHASQFNPNGSSRVQPVKLTNHIKIAYRNLAEWCSKCCDLCYFILKS